MRNLVLYILFFLACVSLTLIQTAFIAGLGSPFSAINLPLFLTLFAISVFDERYAFLLFGISTTIVGLISSSYLLTPLCIGFLTLVLLSELHERFFTNRTYYSVLTLGGIGLLLYACLLLFWSNTLRFVQSSECYYLQVPSLIEILVATCSFFLLLTLCYGITVLVSKRIRSYFIVSGRL